MLRLHKGQGVSRRHRKAGFVLVAVLAFISSILTLTSASTMRSLAERTRAEQSVARQVGFYAAEAGLIQAMASVRGQLSITGQFPVADGAGVLTVPAPTLSRGAAFDDFDGHGCVIRGLRTRRSRRGG